MLQFSDAWHWFTLTAKWGLTSDTFLYESDFFSLPQSFSYIQTGEALYMSLIEIPVLQSKLSSVPDEKRSYVIILITVLKAAELSSTPMQDNTHIGEKWAGRTSTIMCQKCHELKKMPSIVVLWHLWLPFCRQAIITRSKKDVDGGILMLIYLL